MYTLYLLVSHRIRVLFALLDVLLDDLDVQVAFDTQFDGIKKMVMEMVSSIKEIEIGWHWVSSTYKGCFIRCNTGRPHCTAITMKYISE